MLPQIDIEGQLGHALRNFGFSLKCLTLRRPGGMIVANAVQGAIALATLTLAAVLTDMVWAWPVTGVDAWGLSTTLALVFAVFCAVCLGLLVGNRPTLMLPGLILSCYILSLSLGASVVVGRWLGASHFWDSWAIAAAVCVVPLGFALRSMFRRYGHSDRGANAPIALLIVTLMGQGWYAPDWPVFAWATDTEEEQTASYRLVDVELIYYAQPHLMAAQIAQLAPQTKGQTDIYTLAVGGYADQQVFHREVVAVSARMAQDFDGVGRVLTLSNSRAHPTDFPLANKPNMRSALSAMAARMDTSQDIAMIFLTSHGYPDTVSLSFGEVGVTSLSAPELAEMLAQSGLKNLIVVVSACYSGSFVDDLRGPDRLIITASSTDRTSFGCSDTNEWTWWGRAFFNEALGQTRDFRDAFSIARDKVAEWEARDGLTASLPQIALGSDMNALLDHYMTSRLAQLD